MEDLDALQPNRVLDVIDSADSVSQIVLPLKSILEYIPIPCIRSASIGEHNRNGQRGKPPCIGLGFRC